MRACARTLQSFLGFGERKNYEGARWAMTYTHTQEDSMSMLYRTVVFAMACSIGVVGCRDNGTLTPADLSMGGGGAAGGGGGGGGGGTTAGDMKNYTVAMSVAAMRQGAPGDYELDDVIAIAVTPSGSHMFVQDAAGGDFSAVITNCSSTSGSHPCPVQSTVKTVTAGHKVTIKGTFIKASAASGAVENFYIDSITDNGAGTLPPVAQVTLADVQRGSVANVTSMAPTNKKYWFQHVTVTPAPAAHKVYDISPGEMVFSGATKCSYQLGFGLAPMSTAGAATTMCADMTTQPAASTAPDPTEVLIGTDFYNTFKLSSDCRCYSMFTDTPVTTAMSTTKLGGILIYNTVYMSSPLKAYVYLAPLDNTTDLALQ
jgi:hypothetical protein